MLSRKVNPRILEISGERLTLQWMQLIATNEDILYFSKDQDIGCTTTDVFLLEQGGFAGGRLDCAASAVVSTRFSPSIKIK